MSLTFVAPFWRTMLLKCIQPPNALFLFLFVGVFNRYLKLLIVWRTWLITVEKQGLDPWVSFGKVSLAKFIYFYFFFSLAVSCFKYIFYKCLKVLIGASCNSCCECLVLYILYWFTFKLISNWGSWLIVVDVIALWYHVVMWYCSDFLFWTAKGSLSFNAQSVHLLCHWIIVLHDVTTWFVHISPFSW